MNGAHNTGEHQVVIFRNPLSRLAARHKPILMYYFYINGAETVFKIHNHYILGVKWVSTYNSYYHKEALKVKDIVLNYNIFLLLLWF